MSKVKLTRHLRTFTLVPALSHILLRSRSIMPGTTIEVEEGSKCRMHYDHRTQEAVKVHWTDRTGEKLEEFVLINELEAAK